MSGYDPIVVTVPVLWGVGWAVFYAGLGMFLVFSIYRLFVKIFPLP